MTDKVGSYILWTCESRESDVFERQIAGSVPHSGLRVMLQQTRIHPIPMR